MAALRKYPDELRERAIQLTLDARSDPASRPGRVYPDRQQRVHFQSALTPALL